jgi:hypothetical protein
MPTPTPSPPPTVAPTESGDRSGGIDLGDIPPLVYVGVAVLFLAGFRALSSSDR